MNPFAAGSPVRCIRWLRSCKWSVSNYLLATPSSATLFLDHIATIGREPVVRLPAETVQNRLRLSRMKVTGP